MVFLPPEFFPEGTQAYLDNMTFDHALRDRVENGIKDDSTLPQFGKLAAVREHVEKGI